MSDYPKMMSNAPSITVWIISVLISAVINVTVLWILGNKVFDSEGGVSVLDCVICWISLIAVGIGAGIVMFMASIPVGIVSIFLPSFLGIILSFIALIGLFLFLYLKWGAKVVENSFSLRGGGGGTILVLYLVISAVVGGVVDWVMPDPNRDIDYEYSMPMIDPDPPPVAVTPQTASGSFSTATPLATPLAAAVATPVSTPQPARPVSIRSEPSAEPAPPSAEPAPPSAEPAPPSAEPAPQPESVATPVDREAAAAKLLKYANDAWGQGNYRRAIALASKALEQYQVYLPPEDERIVRVEAMITEARRLEAAEQD